MRATTVSTVLASLVTLNIASADCPPPSWRAGFGAPGVSSNQFTPQVNALHVWDPDGPGPLSEVLVVGGAFITAGGTNVIEGHDVDHILMWNGLTFRGMPGLNGQVLCIEVDNANVLHVGGHFTSTPGGPPNSLPRIARFDAVTNRWRDLAGNGFDGQVNALHIEPSGTLMVGGQFANFTSGGPANRLVRWNGAAWSAVTWEYNGSPGAPAAVWSIFDVPNSEYRTHVGLDAPPGGSCVRAPSQPAGPAPPPFLPGPINGRAHAGLQTPDGRLWAGGSFTHVTDPFGMATPASRVAYRNPDGVWSQAGAGFDGTVHALVSDGNTVYAGGRFFMSGSTSVNNVARWDGNAWQPIGAGFDADVFALAIYRGDLYAGGIFGRAEGRIVAGIARWDGDEWRALGQGAYPVQSNPAITCIGKFEDRIVAAGRFTEIGGQSARRVARLTFEGDWEQLGQGFEQYPHALVELDEDLYALGIFESARPATEQYRLQKFAPSLDEWLDLGGFNQYFSELIIWNNRLVLGGSFTASGATPINRIAMRDGIWGQLGAGFNSDVLALAVFEGELIAGGFFTMSGTTPVARVARWDGAAWQPMGPGLPGTGTGCDVLHVHNGALYAGGSFHGYLRRWDGATWVQVGDPAAFGGCFGGVATLATYYGDLLVGGSFSCGQTGVLRWNGTSYGPMAPGAVPVPNVGSLVALHGDLWMNGVFNSAGGLPASGIALWRDASPWVWVEPTAVTADPGDDVTFTAHWHTDSVLTRAFQWSRNGQEIPGEIYETLTLSNVQAAHAGEYRCTFITFCGLTPVMVESNPASLTITGGGNPCPGDLNGDGAVGLSDLTILLSNFGTASGATPEQGDLNGDGAVGLSDLTILLSNFGTACP